MGNDAETAGESAVVGAGAEAGEKDDEGDEGNDASSEFKESEGISRRLGARTLGTVK